MVHPSDEELFTLTHYLCLESKWEYAQALFQTFFSNPLRLLWCFSLALFISDEAKLNRKENIRYVVIACRLHRIMQLKSIQHLHVHFAFGAATIAFFSRQLGGVPFSITVHGSDVLCDEPLLRHKLQNALFIVQNCHYHERYLRQKYQSLEGVHFHTIRIGLNMNEKQWMPQPYEERLPLRILTVGRLEAIKAQHILIKACFLLKMKKVPFVCKIVGEGSLKDELRSLIDELGLIDEVFLTGALFEDEVIQCCDWCHVMTLTSISEGTPMVLIEAMAKARPVIAPDITGIPEMVEHGKNGYLFSKGSSFQVYEYLTRIAYDLKDAQNMGLQGRILAGKKFNLAMNCKEKLALFSRYCVS